MILACAYLFLHIHPTNNAITFSFSHTETLLSGPSVNAYRYSTISYFWFKSIPIRFLPSFPIPSRAQTPTPNAKSLKHSNQHGNNSIIRNRTTRQAPTSRPTQTPSRNREVSQAITSQRPTHTLPRRTLLPLYQRRPNTLRVGTPAPSATIIILRSREE